MKKLFITMFIVGAFLFVGDAVSAVTVPGCNIYCHNAPQVPVVQPTPCCAPQQPVYYPPTNPCCVPAPQPQSPCSQYPNCVPTPIPEPVVDNCRISSFTSNRNYVTSGEAVTLRWITTGDCYKANLSDYGSVSTYGSRTIYPTVSDSYTLRAYGYNNTDSEDLYITVNGGNTNILPNVSTYNPSYLGTGSAVLNGYASISSGTMNAWIEFPCYSTNYGNRYSVSSTNLSGTVYNLKPNTTYSYCAAGQSTYGSQIVRGNIVSFTTIALSNPVDTDSSVRTNAPTYVSRNSGTMNGTISNPNNYSLNGYFEYGTSVGLGSRTSSKTLGNSNTINFSETLTGLSEGTIYYYRAVSEGSNGTQRGLIEVFGTTSPTKTVVINKQPTVQKRYKTIYVPTIVEDTSPIIDEVPVEQPVQNNLGANAFWSAMWLQYGPYFWLLIIIIILLIILLARTYRNDGNTKTKTTTVVTHDNNIH
ncbi:MAG: hypothetical protein KBD48_03060 [Candidatus Pacebacteria bacterium]|nr:hypothetical protein [Candidatus Paceibacterota bacterium]MBP9716139.1 hypothetical protein [Candidatus Paceibacterota bacterium]